MEKTTKPFYTLSIMYFTQQDHALDMPRDTIMNVRAPTK